MLSFYTTTRRANALHSPTASVLFRRSQDRYKSSVEQIKNFPFPVCNQCPIKNIGRAHFATTSVTGEDKHTATSEQSFLSTQRKQVQAELDRIKQEIDKVCQNTDQQNINVNSPRQVSMAIFGGIQSTSRPILRMASKGEISNLNKNGQRIATLVMEYRDLHKKLDLPASVDVEGNKQDEFPPNETNKVQEKAPLGIHSARLTKHEKKPFLTWEMDGYRCNMDPNSSFHTLVDSLFTSNSIIPKYWKEHLLQLLKPSARSLVEQLDASICPMGYDPLVATTSRSTSAGQKGSFLAFCREQKQKYKDCIILTRCGDFYETFGLDAILLVEHCGLNSMGGKVRAGCPIRNVQATLDCLTEQGFQVAVYEEAADTDASSGASSSGGSKSRLKSRMLSQIVTPASPTYLYDLVLLNNAADTLAHTPAARPYFGIISSSAGYTLVEVSMEERSARVCERLTAEAVACRLAAYPPAEPLLYIPSPSEYEIQLSSSLQLKTPFLPSRGESKITGPGSRPSIKVIPPSLVEESHVGIDDVELAFATILNALLKLTEPVDEDTNDWPSRNVIKRATINDFTLISSYSSTIDASKGNETSHTNEIESAAKTHTNPLHLETAAQLGLMNDSTIPSLVSRILPNSAPAATRRFLRRHLLTIPPPIVCEAMANLVVHLKDRGGSLPPLVISPLSKVLALLRAGQASADVYGELMHSMNSIVVVLQNYHDANNFESDLFVKSFMTLVEHESGLAADPHSLKDRCSRAIDVIEQVIGSQHHVTTHGQDSSTFDPISDFDYLLPPEFAERNEAQWRGRIQPSIISETYAAVEHAAKRLTKAVAKDFYGIAPADISAAESSGSFSSKVDAVEKSIVQVDVFNNIIAIKAIPRWFEENKLSRVRTEDAENERNHYFHPRDRKGKLLGKRYTTNDVQSALSDYVAACEQARDDVSNALMKLSQTLYDGGHIPVISQAAHANLILSSVFHHARQATALGWSMGKVYEKEINDVGRSVNCITDNATEQVSDALTDTSTSLISSSNAGYFEKMWPYWMDRSSAVENTFNMNGIFLLTAPNMSGKSTLMRSTAAAALLTVCGLCAPMKSTSQVRRFDNLFVRGASADVPTERKSAFGVEMSQVAALFRSSGDKSLVFVDELGRGTSPRDGTSLGAAVLEAMAEKGMSGIFATHLHDILKLPLRSNNRILRKCIAIHDGDNKTNANDNGAAVADCLIGNSGKWTYLLIDGTCTDSMALITAAHFGLPDGIIQRAKELTNYQPGSTTAAEAVKTQIQDRGTAGKFTKSNWRRKTVVNRDTRDDKSLEKIKTILESITNTAGNEIHLVKPMWTPSVSLEGKACLYILELNQPNPSYYVGETNSIHLRIRQHRAKGGPWSHSQAFVVSCAGGKSEARVWESRLIERLSKSGYNLKSTWDGRSIRCGSLCGESRETKDG